MTTGAKQLLIVGTFLLLSVVAIWGWMRKPSPANGPYATNYGYAPPIATKQATEAEPAAADQTSGSVVNPCVSTADYRMGTLPMYASRDYVRTLRPRTDVEPHPAPASQYVDNGAADREYVAHPAPEREAVHQGRSRKKSALIVAGSAGAGAAVGALAGGGKGAGIGAVTGGVAGFIYDRLTHKH